MKILFLSLFSLMVFFNVSGQSMEEVPFEKKYFPNQYEAFDSAYAELEKGDALFEKGLYQYKNALNHYLNAYEFNPNSAELNYKIGICIISTIHKYQSAGYFDKAYKLDPKVSEEILYELAEAHHINEDWDTAMYWYDRYEEYVNKQKKYKKDYKLASLQRCDKKIEECKFGKEFSANPVRVKIENLGPNINTEYSEFGPIISADESVMFFTSKRPGSIGIHVSKRKDHEEPEYFEDIYVSFKQKDGTWSEAENMGHPLNTHGQDATVWISPDGHHMILYNSENGGTLYQTELEGENWTKPHKLDNNINSPFHETSATYSLDKKTVYFVSNREDNNFGEYDIFNDNGEYTHDIYFATWNEEKNEWGEAQNMGPTINTEYNERGVFMHPDGKTLFFSSEGHNSMGGYDVFTTKLVNGKWTKPENLGYPVNGPDHDVYFVLNAAGSKGYYSRRYATGYGEKDIYSIRFLDKEKSLENLEANNNATGVKNTTILKGLVTNELTGEPVNAVITITDNDKHEVVFTSKSNSHTGKYLVSLPSGSHYGIAIEAEGFLFHSENFDLDSSALFTEIVKDINLKPIEIGNSIILKNIFFDSRESTLTNKSIPELERLTVLLTENPNLKIEISGHTDNIGSDNYNLSLSNDRATTVVNYLTNKGINKNRLIAVGYGEQKPIANNETNEGRALNRRTEFKILEK